MSSRLIILPKKSWHVGKRENIEKVLRDERIAEEQAAAAKERSREITQEEIMDKLKRSLADKSQGQAEPAIKPPSRKRRRESKDGKGGMGQGWGASMEHVNFFGEEERAADKMVGKNADHEREKREQDLLAQRRSGLAPTAFGEGSAEVMKAQPWYNIKPTSAGSRESARAVRLGREVSGEEAQGVLDRDAGRKVQHDPMGSLLRPHGLPNPVDQAPRRAPPTVATGAVSKNVGVGVEDDDSASGASTTHSVSKERRKRRKLEKGRRKEKEKEKEKEKKGKEKKREREKEKEWEEKKRKERKERKKEKEKKEKNRHKEENTRGEISLQHGHEVDHGESSRSKGDAETESRHGQKQDLEELRRRRLAREGGERTREIRLLAEEEMAGRPVPNERSIAYNNQYNAPAARQNTRPSKHHDGQVRRR